MTKRIICVSDRDEPEVHKNERKKKERGQYPESREHMAVDLSRFAGDTDSQFLATSLLKTEENHQRVNIKPSKERGWLKMVKINMDQLKIQSKLFFKMHKL